MVKLPLTPVASVGNYLWATTFGQLPMLRGILNIGI